jgi:peptidoglycan/xylan/chitin deacetylase (PgdA/CDA1 family)
MSSTSLVRRAAKSVAANVLHYTGARRAIAAARRMRAGGRRVLILSYHRVVEDFTGALQRSIPGLLISQETFRRQLQDLREDGYEFLSLAEALEVLAGRKRTRSDVCVVTFDDGYRDVYRYGLPVLKELGIPATMYLPSGLIGTNERFTHDRLFHLFQILQQRRFRPVYDALPATAAAVLVPLTAGTLVPAEAVDLFLGDHPGQIARRCIDALTEQLGGGPELIPTQGDVMNWDDVRAMIAAGLEMGAHTVTHTVLPLEEPERAEWEIRASKAEIEDRTGRPCRDFAYCNGWYSDELIRILAQAGFRSAVTTEDRPNRIGGDPFTLKRKVLWENFSVGFDGTYSSPLTGCQMDDVFTTLGGGTVVIGRKAQRREFAAPLLVSASDLELHGGR